MAPLHHIALGADDVERVAAFYREVFGLGELARHLDDAGALRSIWLDLGGAILMVERVPATLAAPRQPRPDGVSPGPFLLAFTVARAERGAVEATLEARGAPIEGRTGYTSYARDPEGNRVGISCYPHPTGGPGLTDGG